MPDNEFEKTNPRLFDPAPARRARCFAPGCGRYRQTHRCGAAERGSSQLTAKMGRQDFLLTEVYSSEEQLRSDVGRGAVSGFFLATSNFKM